MSMARSSAIKRGQALSAAEMDKLISDLFRLTSPGLTPRRQHSVHHHQAR